jgi:hypothetical protein
MPIIDGQQERLPLQLKHMEVFKIKNMENNIMFKREYLATKTENTLARQIHTDTDGLYGIKPTEDYWSPVDFILYQGKLNIKIYVELKNRGIEDKYETLMIGKSKICMIIDKELYPTYIINTFENATYVYVVEDEDFLIKYKRNDTNIFVPKSVCFTYEQFINKLMDTYYFKYNYNNINPETITP